MSFQNCKVVQTRTNPAEYLKMDIPRGEVTHPVSPSMLREFARCPSRWRHGYVSPESTAKDWGSLFDCLSLTPEQFESRYVVQPEKYENEKGENKPWNNNANVCKSWHEEQIGREIIASKQLRSAKDAVKRLLEDEIICNWFWGCDCQVWVAGEWHDEKTKLVVPVRCLIDFVPRADTEFSKCLGDLKSTRTAAVLPWQRDCFQMGYHVQAAFDTDLYVAATGEDRNTWCWILGESFEPWEPGKRMMSQDFLVLGRETYRRMLENYCACLKANRWPGYDDTDEAVQGWSLVEAEPWMAERAMFAPRFEFDAPADVSLESEGITP